MYNKLTLTITCVLWLSSAAQAQEWQPVTGADNITALFSDTTHTGTLRDGVTATATYNADGTGNLRAWGDVIERRWRVEGDDQVCLEIGTETPVRANLRLRKSPRRLPIRTRQWRA